MQKDILKGIIDKIENWCLENNVSVFYGEVDENKATEINWIQTDNADWGKYLNVLKRAESKIVTVTIRKNEVDDIDEDVAEYLETLYDQDKKNYQTALAVVKKNKGQIAYFILTFFTGNTSYQYQQQADWIEDYKTVYEAYVFDDNDEDGEADDTGLTDDQIEKAARK